MTSVVVLNADHQAIQQVSLQHAVRMLVREVAVIHEADGTKNIGPFPVPKVLRLVKYIYVKWRSGKGSPRYSRTNLLKRDKYTCCYCGKFGETVDHIEPVSRGGVTSWLNCVASCRKCNGRKRDRTPEEANMPRQFEPYIPTFFQLNN